jgi:hypothetical protein
MCREMLRIRANAKSYIDMSQMFVCLVELCIESFHFPLEKTRGNLKVFESIHIFRRHEAESVTTARRQSEAEAQNSGYDAGHAVDNRRSLGLARVEVPSTHPTNEQRGAQNFIRTQSA